MNVAFLVKLDALTIPPSQAHLDIQRALEGAGFLPEITQAGTETPLLQAIHERIEAERKQAVKDRPKTITVEDFKTQLGNAWDLINDIALLTDPSALAEEHRADSFDLVRARTRNRAAGTGRMPLARAIEEFTESFEQTIRTKGEK